MASNYASSEMPQVPQGGQNCRLGALVVVKGDIRKRDDVILLNLLGKWVPDEKLRHRILVENPEKFYGFDPAKRPKAL